MCTISKNLDANLLIKARTARSQSKANKSLESLHKIPVSIK